VLGLDWLSIAEVYGLNFKKSLPLNVKFFEPEINVYVALYTLLCNEFFNLMQFLCQVLYFEKLKT